MQRVHAMVPAVVGADMLHVCVAVTEGKPPLLQRVSPLDRLRMPQDSRANVSATSSDAMFPEPGAQSFHAYGPIFQCGVS